MKKIKKILFAVLASVLCISAVSSNGAAMSVSAPVYQNYSCVQLAALNEFFRTGVEGTQRTVEKPTIQLAYFSAGAANQQASIHTAFEEQAEAVFLAYVSRQCLAD
jgi:hypothetical protein